MPKKRAPVLCGLAIALASCTGEPADPGGDDAESPRRLSFRTSEATWTSVTVSPDGDSIVFDLLGDLYRVNAAGGQARRITSGPDWDIEPRFSPDGHYIAFVSDRDGTENVWIVRPDGSGLAQLSREQFEGVGSPAWSHDGTAIFARQKLARRSFTYKGPWVLNRYALDGGPRRTIVGEHARVANPNRAGNSGPELLPTGPSAAPDGASLYFAGQAGELRPGERPYVEFQVIRLDLETGEMTVVTGGEGGAFRPEVSPDGRLLAFGRREGDRTSLWVRDLEEGTERRLLPGITRDDQGNRAVNDLIPAYSWTANSQSIVIAREGGIVRVDVSDGTILPVPFTADVSLELEPRIAPRLRVEQGPVVLRALRSHRLSPDGRTLAFQGAGKIWLEELPDGQPYPLNGAGVTPSAYDEDEWFEYAPAWSPDGKRIAWSAWGKSGSGHIHVTDIASGATRQLTDEPGEYSNLAFSPDGLTLAFAATLPRAHFLDRPSAEIRTIDLRSGKQSTVAATPSGDPAPRFSAEGDRLFYIEPTDRRGRQFVSVNLLGGDKIVHFAADWLSEAVPSPDDARAAFVIHDNVYVMDLPNKGGGEQPPTLDDLDSIERISRAGASVGWLDPDTPVWGYGNRFFGTPGAGDDGIAIELEAPRDRPEGLVAFTGAKIITMRGPDGGIIDEGDVLVENNRISKVGVAGSFPIPDAAVRIDAAGKTILPGFVDLHAHPSGRRPSGLIDQDIRGLQADLAYGVTTIHDPAVNTSHALGAAELIETGQVLGPRYYTAGAQVIGFSGPYNEWIDSFDTARTVAARRKRLGAVSLKEYGQPSRIQRQWLARAARELGLRIVSEGTGGFHAPLTQAVDGFTGIEHSIAHAPLYRDVVELLAFSGVAYDPVLVHPRRGAGARNYLWDTYRATGDLEKLLRYVDPTRIEYLERRRAETVFSPYDFVFVEQGRDARSIAAAGGSVVTGSHGDGITLHFDIWGYVTAGMTPLEALQTATVSGIEALGLESDLGTIEAGKLADFVVLEADPLEDIRNTRRLELVVKNGEVYDDESLDQVWPERRRKPIAYWLRPPGGQ